MQLLAASLGARVYAGPQPEVGLLPVEITPEGRADPVFADLPADLVTLQWHGDTFDLPDGAVRLAGSPAYANQAFRVGRAYGVQFHLEVSTAMAASGPTVPAYAASLERTLGPGAAGDFVRRIEERSAEMLANGRGLFERWLDAVVAPTLPSPRSAHDPISSLSGRRRVRTMISEAVPTCSWR